MSTIVTGPGIGPINWTTVGILAGLAATVPLSFYIVRLLVRCQDEFWYWRLKRVIKCSRGTR